MSTPQTTFGLDVGSNSLGWAVIEFNDAKGRIVATGVRIFPEGVDRDQKGGEKSKNEQRRISRGMRRQIARRARRKRRLREALVATGLLPDVALLKPDDPRRVAWESHADHQADPYSLRVAALSQRLELFELGRVLLHLAQRRGFLSNRKKDRSAKETSDLVKEMEGLQATLGDKTLGQHLLTLRGPTRCNRIRGLHTMRKMYEAEFDRIWNKQKDYYPELLTNALRHGTLGRQEYPVEPRTHGEESLLGKFGIEGLLFFQRRMYWPKAAIGRCELEPKLPRCPRADRSAQRFRLLQEVNNLRLLDTDTLRERPLDATERQRLLAWLSQHKDIKFDDIPRRLGLLDGVRFNLERGSRKSLKGMETDCILAGKSLFGKEWFDKPEQVKDAIVRALLDEQLDDDTVIAMATREWGLSSDAAKRVAELSLPEGHARYSLTAINKLLPHLERGLRLNSATGEECALRESGYINPHEKTFGQMNELPPPPEVTNPLVRQALYEVRKVVNALLRTYGKPAHIHIEMAREIKGGAQERAELSQQMRDREQLRDDAADEIRSAGLKPTSASITRYLLWKEQGEVCIYSGRPISSQQLMEGDVDEDHILPYSRSLDNSQMNRVLCFRAENAAKGDRTPHEWLAATQPEKYEQILQRAVKLPYPKAKRFRQESVELTDFFARQFVDTAYIATQVREYVQCLGVDVVCTKGQHTAELRRHWGLNTILRDDGLDLKNREDHRHHAVDALVIALTDRKRLQELARLYKNVNRNAEGETLDDPWDGFRTDAETAINAINVSHRALRKIRGALHEETIYSPTRDPLKSSNGARPWAKNWIEEDGVFTYRKPLETLTLAEVENIRDPRVKEIVLERLRQFNVVSGRKKKGAEDAETGGKRAIPKEAWKQPLYVTPAKPKDGEMIAPAPIKKVRIIKRELTIQPIGRRSRYIKPGSLHHLCIFEFVNEKGKKVREPIFVDMIEASRRALRKEPIIQRKHPTRADARFLFSLSRGEMVQGVFKGQTRLVVFSTAASTQGQIYFLDHTDARPSAKTQKFAVMANTLNGRKVAVDPLGRLRWAND